MKRTIMYKFLRILTAVLILASICSASAVESTTTPFYEQIGINLYNWFHNVSNDDNKTSTSTIYPVSVPSAPTAPTAPSKIEMSMDSFKSGDTGKILSYDYTIKNVETIDNGKIASGTYSSFNRNGDGDFTVSYNRTARTWKLVYIDSTGSHTTEGNLDSVITNLLLNSNQVIEYNQDILPDSPLYSIKIAIESWQIEHDYLIFSVNASTKAQRTIEFLDRRINDTSRMISKNVDSHAVNNSIEHMQRALDNLNNTNVDNDQKEKYKKMTEDIKQSSNSTEAMKQVIFKIEDNRRKENEE
jgi:hypothetical protein